MIDLHCYSPLKVFHHRDRIDAIQAGQHPPPLHVQLIPTNRCNQNCRGCAYRNAEYTSGQDFEQRDEIPWAKLREVVRDCSAMGVQAIQLTGGGEPTVHPRFLDLCHCILKADISLALVTNGVSWSQRHVDLLKQAAWVRFSFDAATPETYGRYRRAPLDTYQRVRGNLRRLTSEKGPDCVVGVGFVVNEYNWQEIAQACRHAREDGADNFRISALFQNRGIAYFRSFYHAARDLCREAKAMETESFRVFDLFGDRLEDLEQASPDYDRCGQSRLVTYLGADQNAYVCCIYAYNKAGRLGSFQEQRFAELWDSEKVRAVLDNLDPRRCVRCMFNEKNRAIEYALTPLPPHVGFV